MSNDEKQNVIVGFSKKELKNHKGISGLKYYLIVMYIRKHLQTFGQVSLTLNNLLDECGYSTKSHNKSIYSDFREIIKEEIIDEGYATCDVDILNINPTYMFTIQLLENKNLFYTDDAYVQFSISEFEKITMSESSVNKSVLAGVYLFIKQYIIDIDYSSKISYPSKEQIKKGVGVSSISTIESAIAALISLKLIYMRGDMFVESSDEDNVFIPTRNVFALNEDCLAGDYILVELERVYGKKVYNKDMVPGNIRFLT